MEYSIKKKLCDLAITLGVTRRVLKTLELGPLNAAFKTKDIINIRTYTKS